MQTPEALANMYCSKEISRGLHNQIICLSAINALFAITAIVGNIVILNALHKETQARTQLFLQKKGGGCTLSLSGP